MLYFILKEIKYESFKSWNKPDIIDAIEKVAQMKISKERRINICLCF